VLVHVADHALFQRRGADLICDVPLLLQEAALGTELVVPTLDGTTTIRIPPGTPSGKVFRLSGRDCRSSEAARTATLRAGDLHLRTAIEVPRTSIRVRRRRSSRSGAGSGRMPTRCARRSTRS
jgi:molecular chaperone DnaJ